MSILNKLSKKTNTKIAEISQEVAQAKNGQINTITTNDSIGTSSIPKVENGTDEQVLEGAKKTVASSKENTTVRDDLLTFTQKTKILPLNIAIDNQPSKRFSFSFSSGAKQVTVTTQRPQKKLVDITTRSFSFAVKSISSDALFSSILNSLQSQGLQDFDSTTFDKLIPNIEIEMVDRRSKKATPKFALDAKTLLKDNQSFAVLIDKYKDLLDDMQNTPNRIKVLKEYDIDKKKGYFILDSYESNNSYFFSGKVTLDRATEGRGLITELCFFPITAVTKSDTDKKTKETDYNIINITKLREFQVLSDDIQYRLVYAILKNAGIFEIINGAFKDIADKSGNVERSFTLKDSLTLITNVKSNIDSKLETYLSTMYPSDTTSGSGVKLSDSDKLQNFLLGLLGLYRLASGLPIYQASQFINKQTLPQRYAQAFNVISLPELNRAIIECLDVVSIIPQGSVLYTQTAEGIEKIPMPNTDYAISVELKELGDVYYFGKEFSEVIQNEKWKNYRSTDIEKYFKVLALVKKTYKDYEGRATSDKTIQGSLNVLEIPKLFEDYLAFVCDSRVCCLKAEDGGIWGFISNEISALALYKLGYQHTEGQTNLLERVYINRNGVVFKNDYITVVNSMINKISEKTASRLIRLQKAYIQAYNNSSNEKNPQKTITEPLFASSRSLGVGVIPQENAHLFGGMPIMTPKENQEHRLSLRVTDTTLSFYGKDIENKEKLFFQTKIVAPMGALNQDVCFEIHPKFSKLLEMVSLTNTDIFVNILNLWQKSLFDSDSNKPLVETLLYSDIFDVVLPSAVLENIGGVMQIPNSPIAKQLVSCLLLTIGQGTMIIPLMNRQVVNRTKSGQTVLDIGYDGDLASEVQDLVNADASKLEVGDSKMPIFIMDSGSPILPYAVSLITKPQDPTAIQQISKVLMSHTQMEQLRDGQLSVTDIFQKELFLKPFIGDNLGYILFRDVWSSGYTVGQLFDMDAIAKENGSIKLTKQFFSDRFTTKYGVDFKKDNLAKSYEFLVEIDMNAFTVNGGKNNRNVAAAELEKWYLNASAGKEMGINNEHIVALTQQKKFPVYLKEMGKENVGGNKRFDWNEKVSMLNQNYFNKEILEEEFLEYFPEYFASIKNCPKVVNYPQNATHPEDIAKNLITDMLDLSRRNDVEKKIDFGLNFDPKKYTDIPNYTKANGFAGKMFESLLPFTFKGKPELEVFRGIYDNPSAMRYKIFLRYGETSGWIDAKYTTEKGINLFAHLNTFHAVELMTPIPMMAKDSTQPTNVPLWKVLVEHYQGQGLDVAFMPSFETEAMVDYEGAIKLYLPSAGSASPNFFMLQANAFTEAGIKGKTRHWWKKRSVVSSELNIIMQRDISLEDPFLGKIGFYYYLATFDPRKGSIGIGTSNPSYLDTKQKEFVSEILSGLLMLSEFRGDEDLFKEYFDKVLCVTSIKVELEGRSYELRCSDIIENANMAYVKLVNWWIDLDAPSRNLFKEKYLQRDAGDFIYKYQLPQHQNNLFPREAWPKVMSKKLATDFDFLPFQKQAINAALSQNRIVFSMEMGLGKTISALTAFLKLKEDRIVDRMLLVVPSAPILSWKTELRDRVVDGPQMLIQLGESSTDREGPLVAFERGEKAILLLTPYFTNYSDDPLDPSSVFHKLLKMLNRVGDRTLLVVDEMHNFKGLETQRGLGLREISKKCARVIGMTGTLKPNSILDFYAGLELVVPGIFSGDKDKFLKNFSLKSKSEAISQSTFSPMRLNKLYRIVAPYLFTRVLSTQESITHPEIVSLALQPILSDTKRIKDAIDSIQNVLIQGMTYLKQIHTTLKAVETSAIKTLEVDLDALNKEKNQLIKKHKDTQDAKNMSEEEKERELKSILGKAIEVGAKIAEVQGSIDEYHRSSIFLKILEKFKRCEDVDPADYPDLESNDDFDDERQCLDSCILRVVRDHATLGLDIGTVRVRTLQMAAFVSAHIHGVYNHAYEKILLSPAVLLNEVAFAINNAQLEGVDVESFVDFWAKLIPSKYVARKMDYIASAVIEELNENPNFNCLVFGFYVETLTVFREVLVSKGVKFEEIGIIRGAKSNQGLVAGANTLSLDDDADEDTELTTPKKKHITQQGAYKGIAVTQKARETLMQRFNGVYEDDTEAKPLRVLIAQITTLNAGANLQKKCKFVAFLTTPWSPAELTQAQGRVWRMPQREKVKVLRPTCSYIDEMKESRLVMKMNADSQAVGVATAGNETVASGLGLKKKEVVPIETILSNSQKIYLVRGQAYQPMLVSITGLPQDIGEASGTLKAITHYDILDMGSGEIDYKSLATARKTASAFYFVDEPVGLPSGLQDVRALWVLSAKLSKALSKLLPEFHSELEKTKIDTSDILKKVSLLQKQDVIHLNDIESLVSSARRRWESFGNLSVDLLDPIKGIDTPKNAITSLNVKDFFEIPDKEGFALTLIDNEQVLSKFIDSLQDTREPYILFPKNTIQLNNETNYYIKKGPNRFPLTMKDFWRECILSYATAGLEVLVLGKLLYEMVQEQKKQEAKLEDDIFQAKLKVEMGRELETNPYFFEGKAFKPIDIFANTVIPEIEQLLKKAAPEKSPDEIKVAITNFRKAFQKYFERPEFAFVSNSIRSLFFNTLSFENSSFLDKEMINELKENKDNAFWPEAYLVTVGKSTGITTNLFNALFIPNNEVMIENLVLSPLEMFLPEDNSYFYLGYNQSGQTGDVRFYTASRCMAGLFVYLNAIQGIYKKVLCGMVLEDMADNKDLKSKIVTTNMKLVERLRADGVGSRSESVIHTISTHNLLGVKITMKIPFDKNVQSGIFEAMQKQNTEFLETFDFGRSRQERPKFYDPFLLADFDLSGVIESYIRENTQTIPDTPAIYETVKLKYEGGSTGLERIITESFKTAFNQSLETLGDMSGNYTQLNFLANGQISCSKRNKFDYGRMKNYKLLPLQEVCLRCYYPKDSDELKMLHTYDYSLRQYIPCVPYPRYDYNAVCLPEKFPKRGETGLDVRWLHPINKDQINPLQGYEILNPLLFEQTKTKEGLLALFRNPPTNEITVSSQRNDIFYDNDIPAGEFEPLGKDSKKPLVEDNTLYFRKREKEVITYIPNPNYSLDILFKQLLLCDANLRATSSKIRVLKNTEKTFANNSWGFSADFYDNLVTFEPTAQESLSEMMDKLEKTPGDDLQKVFKEIQKLLTSLFNRSSSIQRITEEITKGIILAAEFSAYSMLRAVFLTLVKEQLPNVEQFYPTDASLNAVIKRIVDDACPYTELKDEEQVEQQFGLRSGIELTPNHLKNNVIPPMAQREKDYKIAAERLHGISQFLKKNQMTLKREEYNDQQVKFVQRMSNVIETKIAMLEKNTRLLETVIKKHPV